VLIGGRGECEFGPGVNVKGFGNLVGGMIGMKVNEFEELGVMWWGVMVDKEMEIDGNGVVLRVRNSLYELVVGGIFGREGRVLVKMREMTEMI
ncbi:hypothetical protein, partial [Paenibacillus xylanexedens]|uniref:hypothetical protein n=1 Tax=Paenibacillus xylanexedens TaxID=528191 RepID=UPI001C92BB43